MDTNTSTQAETAAGSSTPAQSQQSAGNVTLELSPSNPAAIKEALEKAKRGELLPKPETIAEESEEVQEEVAAVEEVEAAAEEQSEEEEAVEAAEATEGEEAPVKETLPNRISVKGNFSSIEQEAIALGKQLKDAGEEVPSLKERIELVEARHARATESAHAEEETGEVVAAPVEQATTALATLNTERDALMQKKAELSAGGQLYGEEHIEIERQLEVVRDKIADAKADLRVAAREAKASTETKTASIVAQRQTVLAEAYKEYPTAGNPNSPVGKIAADLAKAMQNPDHPDHAMLFGVNSGRYVIEQAVRTRAGQIAQERGITLEAATAVLRAKSTAQPAKASDISGQKAVKPVSGGKGTAPAAKPPTGSEILAKAWAKGVPTPQSIREAKQAAGMNV